MNSNRPYRRSAALTIFLHQLPVRLGLLAMLAALFLVLTALSPADPGSASPAAPTGLTIQLGPVEIVRGPDYYTDNYFNTLPSADRLRAYIANATTLVYEGGSLETMRQVSAPALQAGTSFDSCGAWLNSAYQDGAITHAWYHAETVCTYGLAHKTVGYAESTDGGLTFTKPNYPGNQVITAPSTYTDPAQDDEGDLHVIAVGDYYYMYFMPNRDWQVRLARAPLSSGGTVGTWQKYFNGAFSPPGLGGESSPIDPSGALTSSWVSWNAYLQSFQGFSFMQRAGIFAGFGMTFSPNGINGWSSNPYLVLSVEGDWGTRTSASKELVAYPSLISLYGDGDEIGQTFWLYYMYIKAGEDFAHRYLVRRQVNFGATASSAPADLVPKLALAQYTKADDTWFTTTAVDSSYQRTGVLGYLFADDIPNSKPVYDCYRSATNDHTLIVDDPTCQGATYLRRAGWISSVAFTSSIAVYRCWDAAATNHFVSTDSACNGKALEVQLGYLAQLPAFPQNEYVALSDYYKSNDQDSWVTTTTPPAAYTFNSRLGYLYTQPGPNTVDVYDCYNASATDHQLVLGDSTCAGLQSLGRLGWISTVAFPNARTIYRCFDAAANNHFVAVDPGCGGKLLDWQIGYLALQPEAWSGQSPTSTAVGPSTSTPTVVVTNTLTPAPTQTQNGKTKTPTPGATVTSLPSATPTATPSRTPTSAAITPLTPTSTRTSSPTATRTASPTPTRTATAAATDLIFADGFEGGGLTAWSSSSTDGGDLSVTSGAALVGGLGIQAVLDDNLAIYVTDDRPATERRYRARVYFDPNSIRMATGDHHVIFYGYNVAGSALAVLRLELAYNGTSYRLRAGLLGDNKAWIDTAWVTITDATHYLEWDWRAASGPGMNNGGLTLWLDGVQQSNLAGVDNDTRTIDRVQLGAVEGVDAGTRGTYFFDAFKSGRLNYIGP